MTTNTKNAQTVADAQETERLLANAFENRNARMPTPGELVFAYTVVLPPEISGKVMNMALDLAASYGKIIDAAKKAEATVQ